MRRPLSLLLISMMALLVWPLQAGEPCDISNNPCLIEAIEKVMKKGWVGIQLHPAKRGGWRIDGVVPESPAELAGLKRGDLLKALNGVSYDKKNWQRLEKVYGEMVPGNEMTYTVQRGKEELKVTVKLGKVPEQLMAQWVGKNLLASYEQYRKEHRDH